MNEENREKIQRQTIAAIDIGSNSIRMAVGQLTENGRVEVLERLHRAVHLGQDSFIKGSLGRKTMTAAVSILRDYQQVLKLYDVKNVRVIATSSVREASNSDTFIDRVLMATGLEVSIIDTSEESRLTVLAVRDELKTVPDMVKNKNLIAEVGGGSTILTVLEKGKIIASQSLGLGSIRLLENYAFSTQGFTDRTKLMENEIKNILGNAEEFIPLKQIKNLVVIGADARFARDQFQSGIGNSTLARINKTSFNKLVKKCSGLAPEQLSKIYELPFADAETLSPALLVYRMLLKFTETENIYISNMSMRQGLLLDMANQLTGKQDRLIGKEVLQSANMIAKKYHVNITHSKKISEFAVKLFNQLKDLHGLNERNLILLKTAAMLHGIGRFVSTRGFHKHSHYLISNSEIFGLNSSEIQIVAQVARYHRKSKPKQTHTQYLALPREKRIIINKLAAILRIADALDTSTNQQIKDFDTRITEEDFIITAKSTGDISPQRRAVAVKSDMFEDVYSLRVHLE